MEIIIGRNGNQPFPINNAGVSNLHAKMSVVDDLWILEDLDSTNGTFIQDKDGIWQRIAKKQITPDTVIRLGDTSVNGITFWASRLQKKESDDYAEEFACIASLNDALEEEKKELQKKARLKKLIPSIVQMAIILGTLPLKNMWVVRGAMIVGSFVNVLIDYNGPLTALLEKKRRLLVCPKCGKPLTDFELQRCQCSNCKVHA